MHEEDAALILSSLYTVLKKCRQVNKGQHHTITDKEFRACGGVFRKGKRNEQRVGRIILSP